MSPTIQDRKPYHTPKRRRVQPTSARPELGPGKDEGEEGAAEKKKARMGADEGADEGADKNAAGTDMGAADAGVTPHAGYRAAENDGGPTQQPSSQLLPEFSGLPVEPSGQQPGRSN